MSGVLVNMFKWTPKSGLLKNTKLLLTYFLDSCSVSRNSKDGDMSSKTAPDDRLGHEKSEESFKEWNTLWNILQTKPSAGVIDLIPGSMSLHTKDSENEVDSGNCCSFTNGSSDPRRWYFALRHGERMDLTYGQWTQHCFDDTGNYTRKDLNMPLEMAHRTGGAEAYRKDGPLTRVGALQAYLVGEGLRLAGIKLTHVYASSALRCVDTAHNMLLGLQADPSVKIRVEPGLFEYKMWHSHNRPLQFMSPIELHKAGFNVDLNYKPYLEVDPHTDETLDDYYKRGEQVMYSAVKDTADEGGNIIFVGHAATIDMMAIALTRLGQDSTKPHSYQLSKNLLRVPYCALGAVKDKPWQLVAPPCPPSLNSSSGRFDWKMLHELL